MLDVVFDFSTWWLHMKMRYACQKPHLQRSHTLNLATQILEKRFFEGNQKKSKVESSEVFFVEWKYFIETKYFSPTPTSLAL